MEYVSGNSLIAKFFVYRSFGNQFDINVHAINGHFHQPETISHFITNPNEYELNSLEKLIFEKYPESEHDQFYWVYANLEYISGEFGDYGESICEPYYTIGEVLEVVVEEVDYELEDIDPTESPSEASAV